MSSYERTGWRDQAISERHRVWGEDCPCIDIDFLLVEFNRGKPVALVEYKDIHAQSPNIGHPSYRALIELANGHSVGALPFLIAFYQSDIWAFRIIPVNEAAKAHFAVNEMLTEIEYVSRLYRLRNFVLPEHVKKKLQTKLPNGATVLRRPSGNTPTYTKMVKQTFETIKTTEIIEKQTRYWQTYLDWDGEGDEPA
jgi:hypothetical protein